jgi:excisionase family DNA binding protein
VTVEEAAVRLGCKPGLVYKLCAAGRLGHLRIGFGRGRVVIEEHHLDEYRRRVEVLPVPDAAATEGPPAPKRTARLAVRDYVGEWERRRKGRRPATG